MRPVKGKSVILDGPPEFDDGDPHLCAPGPGPISEQIWALGPADRRAIAAGGAVRLRLSGGRLSVDIAPPEEIQ